MYKKCATEASTARQRQLEQGLLLAMSKHRYEEISVSDLCEELGIPRKSFYRYFSGKEGALHALLDHTLQEYEMLYVPALLTQKQGFRLGISTFFQFWQGKKQLLDALERSGLSGVLIERAISYAVDGLPAESRNFQPEHRKLVMESTIFGICGLMSMVVRWHHDGYAMDVGSMSAMATKLLTEPLFTGN